MTSTELEQMPAEVPQVDDLTELQVWARDLKTAYSASVSLVTTSFVPDSYKGKPEEAAAAILTGQEIGLSPLASLRSIDIINGVPGMRAIALRALVQSHGHEIWVEEQTATRAVVKGRRKGSDKVETSVWTIERAAQLGLTGKENWRKQPIAMLLARATSECARLVAADVLLGIPYSIEELEDLGPVDLATGEAKAKPAARRTMKRAALPRPKVEEPPLEGGDESAPDTVSEPEPEPEPVPVSEPDEAAPSSEEYDAPVVESVAGAEPVKSWPVAPIPLDADAPALDEPELDWGGPQS